VTEGLGVYFYQLVRPEAERVKDRSFKHLAMSVEWLPILGTPCVTLSGVIRVINLCDPLY
jgi:hypothetical protein